MIHLQRGPAPDFWTRQRVKQWSDRWLAKECDSNRWAWPQFQRKSLNQHATEAMEIWHFKKCAFCEAPLWGQDEIEHFRSKTGHPLAAFIWRNLFLICKKCNLSKGSENHEGCLKPDREDPADYLWVNPVSLKIEPKPGILAEAHLRATNTIERYKLDRPELKKLYNDYLQKSLHHGHILPLIGIVAQAQKHDPQAAKQIPLRLAGLQALAQPEQPFSLMVKSLLEYYNAI